MRIMALVLALLLLGGRVSSTEFLPPIDGGAPWMVTSYAEAMQPNVWHVVNGVLHGPGFVSTGNVGIATPGAPLGLLHVGNSNNLNSTNPAVLVSRTISGVASGHGFADNSLITTGAGLGYNSFDARVNLTGTIGMDHYAAFQAFPNYNSSGTITELMGYSSAPVVAAGTVTTLNHASIVDATGAGTVNTQYGVFVGALTKGTNNYAIWTDGATKSRLGHVGIGVAPDADSLLHVYSTGANGAYLNTESSDTLGGSGYRLQTNTVLRWTMEVPAASTLLRFMDASSNVPLSLAQGGNLTITQATLGTNVETLQTTATNDDPVESVSQGRVATTDATPTTVQIITIPTDFTVTISCYVTARRTGGASGAANDGAGYNIEVVMKNTAGTAAEIAAETVRTIGESTAGFNVTSAPSGATELIQVTGAATTNITWHSTCRTWQVGS